MRIKDALEKWGNAELKEGFEKHIVKDNSKTVYDLRLGDFCIRLNSDGTCDEIQWSGTPYQQRIRDYGFIFLNADDMGTRRKELEIYEKVKRYTYDFSTEDWSNRKVKKYYPVYDTDGGTVNTIFTTSEKSNTLYFKSEKDVEKAIRSIGIDKFKKYYLKVG